MKDPKYPDVKVTVYDGNAINILSKCKNAARRAGLEEEVIDQYLQEATSGNYQKLLQTSFEWFDVDIIDDVFTDDDEDTGGE